MSEKVLLFGGNSFLAKAFNEKFGGRYEIDNVFRNQAGGILHFDFEDGDMDGLVARLQGTYHAMLFFQGLNPAVGAKDMTASHFHKMLNINIVTPSLLVQKLSGRLHHGALVLFISSVAKKKGSYDPAYASAKAGLTGLMHSLANAYPATRFNILSLGLVEGSPVFNNMSDGFRLKHACRMFDNAFIKADDVINLTSELIQNTSVNRADIEIDGGYN